MKEITSGCVNTSGQLKIRVEKPLEESMVTRILDSVENAAASKPKIDRFITRFARVYTPCVVGIAVATAILPSLVTGNWHYWIYTAITFLVMSCPCALVLSIPLAFFSGIGAGSKKGILFKGGLSIEGLSKLGAVIMDKTGTITEGNFQLQKVVATGKYTENELLSMCAGCEQNSTHPIANSIVAAAKEREIQFEKPISLEEISGHGIVAEMPEGKVLCGNRKLMDKFGVTIGELKEAAYGSEVFMAVNGTFAGYMLISDTIKPDAKEAIASLKKLGLHTVMLTGDSEDSAQAVGKDAGIDEIYAKLLPEDKLNALKKVRQAHGTVMFVGDGINDAPALTRADMGIAIGAGTDVAIDAADVVLMKSRLSDVPAAIRMSRATLRNIHENLFWAFFYNAIGIPLAAGIWIPVFGWKLNPMFGAAAMSLSSFCVVTNALRLNLFKMYDASKDRKRKMKKVETAENTVSDIVLADKNESENKEETKMTKTMKIEGMMCGHCEAAVKKALEALEQVDTAEVSHEAGTAVVTLNSEISNEVLKKTVEDKDYTVTAIED